VTTTTTPSPVLPVRMPSARVRAERPDRLLVVTDPELGDIPCRWRLTPSHLIWRCSACGPMERASCEHTFAAAMYLAEHLLGLTPIDTKETHHD
jgi:hypothetical protein